MNEQAFPTNMVLFDTERITTDMSPQPKKKGKDGDEKELLAQWLQVITGVRLGKPKSIYAQFLAQSGLSPSLTNDPAADEKHPLLKVWGLRSTNRAPSHPRTLRRCPIDAS
jgi:hypothetical protein